MIRKRTTFVVGAGASYELGLPVGEKLKEQIKTLLDLKFDDFGRFIGKDPTLFNALLRYSEQIEGEDFANILERCFQLRQALPAAISIDNLLDAHRADKHTASVGKLAIAKAILEAERSSALFWNRGRDRDFDIGKASGSWLIPLFQKLTENVSKAEIRAIFDNVCFVVFNYDRCLEFFLPRALAAYYALSDQEANELARHARIYHPYGQVGVLDDGDVGPVAAFGDAHPNLLEVANGIQTFTEGMRHDSHRHAIEAELDASENVVFLGFAFHPMNMQILKASNQNSIRRVFGTTIGLADAAVRRVKGDISLTFNKHPDDGSVAALNYLDEVNLEERRAYDFLYAHFRSLE